MSKGLKNDYATLSVFVYGTLKPGGRYHQRYCSRALSQAIPARLRGRLYDFPQWGFPAMTVGEDWVQGYLLRFCGSSAECDRILQQLDQLEGVTQSAAPESDAYQRCWQTVFDLRDRPLQEAWVYRMSESQVKRFHGIYRPDGNWPI
ncbi:MAG: hypothetical protein HLUCCA11_07475 [Phormidesmis priestleyi Ana]|uniref:Gamma-glutamylcyclotransferase AIG2-like domain-containing protein n=1 Tax=Phormidesmis priestleyi Ana TaxID=1666911 RepID=A0A0N8KNB1_9CYAN|nr:MAG: hypothetical protein HLUCCA11_07475 [Phormidesmis priestleyi Ana]